MHKFLSVFSLWSFLTIILAAQTAPENFGQVSLTIDDHPLQNYQVQTAILYENIAIGYDTTLQLRSTQQTNMFFYPQLSKGDRYVLHLILNGGPGGLSKPYPQMLDAFFDLGRKLQDIHYEGRDSSTFLYVEGRFSKTKLYSRNANERFTIVTDSSSGNVRGDFITDFEYPLIGARGQFQKIHMAGELRIPVQNLRVGQETGVTETDQSRKRHFTRNAYIAAVSTLFVILLVLR